MNASNSYCGGASFYAIGVEFNPPERRHTIINSDILNRAMPAESQNRTTR